MALRFEDSFVLLHLFAYYVSSFECGRGFDSTLKLPVNTGTRRERALSVLYFGAIGDANHDDSHAFKDAWKFSCSQRDRIRLVFPVGYKFLLHPLELSGPCKSEIILEIAGTVVAPKDPASWEGLNPRKWIYFRRVNNLILEGGGKINGRGKKWWANSCKINKTMPCQHAPVAVSFHNCKHLSIKNIEIVNSQQMHLSFSSCFHVKASQMMISAPAYSPNTDGIHFSSSQFVVIEDSTVRTGDDCISIVGNSSQISIRNFTCGPGHGISIGSLGKSEEAEQVHDVIVDTAFLSNTANGLRIKTWQGGKGNVSEISFQNVIMDNVSHPIIIEQYYCDSTSKCPNQTSAVTIKNISFVHIEGTSARREAVRFACSNESPCEDIYLEDVSLVSYNGGKSRSFCWQAHGSSYGYVSPPPCFSCNRFFCKEKILSVLLPFLRNRIWIS